MRQKPSLTIDANPRMMSSAIGRASHWRRGIIGLTARATHPETGSTVVGVLLPLVLALATGSWVLAQDRQEPVKIGVLAERGTERCLEKWGPTAEYLTEQIPGCSFVIVPLSHDEVCPTVERGEVNFVLANSSLYVEAEACYGVNRLATLKNPRLDGVFSVYGGLILCRADREDIQELSDLKGETFMAVKETSFGGWRAVWLELKAKGIDPHRDFTELLFGGTQDAVIYAVRDGKVDAGCVRTDTLEHMTMEGKIRREQFRVLNEHSWDEYPFLNSTPMYPEWPIAKVAHTSDELAEKVAVALIGMPADSPAAKAASCAGWTVPLNYQPVHECLKELRVGPYEDFGEVTPGDVIRQYRPWLATAAVFLAVTALATLRVLRLNRWLNRSRLDLSHELLERKRAEERLARQTAVLRAINDVFQRALTCETEEQLGKAGLAVAEGLTGSKFGFLGKLNPAGLMDTIAISNPGWDACELAVSDARRYVKDMPIRGIDRSTIRDEKSRIVSAGEMATHPDRCGTPEGHPEITAFLGVPLKDEGKTVGMIGLGNKEGGYESADQEAVEALSIAIVEALRHKRAEEALRESEERHRVITEAAQDAIVTADATGEIRFWNRAAEKIFGFAASEVLGKNMMDLIVPPQYHEAKRKGLVEFARTGRGAAIGKTLELTALRKNGTEFPIEISVSAYRDRDGLRAVALIRDITERKRTEDALQEERSLLRSLVDVMETMDVGVTIQDPEYNVIYQNSFMQKQFGGRGGKCYEVYERQPKVCDGCPVAKAFRDGRPHTAERTTPAPGGGFFYWDNTAHPIRNTAGEITSCFEVVRNVTQRKHMERARELVIDRQGRLNRLQQGLLGPDELSGKLRMITDGVVNIFGAEFCRIWITRPGDRCESGCMHAELTEGPHVCRHRDRCLWLMASSGRYTHIDGEVHRRVPFGCYKIGRVAAGEEPKFLTNDVTTDPRVHNHDWAKELGLVSFAGYQLRPPDGETIGVLALFAKHAISPDEDALLESLGNTVAQVVQKAKADEALEAAHRRLVDASRRAGMAEVATGVLHNVGNVLNSVNVSASVVADKIRKSEVSSLAKAAQLLSEHANELGTFLTENERGKHLPRFLTALAESLTDEQAAVLKELQSLTDSVEHIKTIVSMQQSYASPSGLVESVLLADLLEDALRMNASSFLRHSIQVERDYSELPPIEIERQKLLQILVNLIRNAKHALADWPGQDRWLTLRITTGGDDRVRIEVTDNGVGIPAENLTRIFAYGFTTKKEKGGLGFGLHHGALLAKEMGGSITAYSDGPGKGATFVLELPLKPAQVPK